LNVTVYKCITQGYDKLSSKILSRDVDFKYIAFTDREVSKNSDWDIQLTDNILQLDAKYLNRYYKFFPHRFLSETDVSIYIDGNVDITSSLIELVDEFVESKALFGCFKHYQRDNIFQEVEACKSLNKFSKTDLQKIEKQISTYNHSNFPREHQLLVGTVLFRRHDDVKSLDEVMELWWEHFNSFTGRDQISLPYILWKTGIRIHVFELDIFSNKYFLRKTHSSIRKQKLIRWFENLIIYLKNY
jgi:hypothetical protein